MSLSVASSSSPAHRGSEELGGVAARLLALQESVAKKGRELDAAHSSHQRQALHLRTLFAHHLMRSYVRAYKQRRLLMSLHLTAMEMQENLDKEEKRRAAHEHSQPSSSSSGVYDHSQPSKATLRKLGQPRTHSHSSTCGARCCLVSPRCHAVHVCVLCVLRCCVAHLYRKRPLLIVAELEERFTHDVKSRFFGFLADYAAVCRENEQLFLRNVQLAKDTLDANTQAEEDRKDKDRWEKEARDTGERCESAERELEELRRKVSRMEREEDMRKRKEAARALQIKTEGYSRAFQRGAGAAGAQSGADADSEEKEAEQMPSGSPLLSPASPRSPSPFFASVPTSPRSKPLGSLHSLPSLPAPPSRGDMAGAAAGELQVPPSPKTATSAASPFASASSTRSSTNRGRLTTAGSSQRPIASARPLTSQKLSATSSDDGLATPLSALSPSGGRSASRSPYASSIASSDGASQSGGGLPSIASPSARRAAQRATAGT